MDVKTHVDFTHKICQCLQGRDDTSALAEFLYGCELYGNRYYTFQGSDDGGIYDYLTERLDCFVRNGGGGFILTRDARKILNNAIETMRDNRISESEIEKRLREMEINPFEYSGPLVYANFNIEQPNKMKFECIVKNAFINLRVIPDYLDIQVDMLNSIMNLYGVNSHM